MLTLPEPDSVLQLLDLLNHLRPLLEQLHLLFLLQFFFNLQFLKRQLRLVILFDVAPSLDVVSGLQIVHDDRFHWIEVGVNLASFNF